MKPLPVRKEKCKTCPFRKDGWTEVRSLLVQRALSDRSPICHSTGKALIRHNGERLKAHICRGARDVQLQFFHSIGFLAEATDECWRDKLNGISGKKSQTMNVAQQIREAMQGLDEFTVHDVYQAVKDDAHHFVENLGASVMAQIVDAKNRGEIQKIGRRRIKPKSVVNVWKRVKDIQIAQGKPGRRAHAGSGSARREG